LAEIVKGIIRVKAKLLNQKDVDAGERRLEKRLPALFFSPLHHLSLPLFKFYEYCY